MLMRCRVRLTKKAKEDATFYFIKDGTFFTLLCLMNPALGSLHVEKVTKMYQK
jgi:hypothetical protein